MFCKKKTKLEKAQKAGLLAIEQVQDALHNLPLDQWQGKLHELKENAGDIAERARNNAADRAQLAADRASTAAERAREAVEAQNFAAKKEVLQGKLSDVCKIAEMRKRAREDKPSATNLLPEQNAGTSKWLWLGLGMLVGGVIALLLAPASGRRSRATLKDKLNQGKSRAGDVGSSASEKVTGKVSEASDRVQNAARDAQAASSATVAEINADVQEKTARDENVDDETIADRVRTELGQNEATRDLERINVSCSEGSVTLHGPKLSAAQKKKVEEVVGAVPGVLEVKSELDS